MIFMNNLSHFPLLMATKCFGRPGKLNSMFSYDDEWAERVDDLRRTPMMYEYAICGGVRDLCCNTPLLPRSKLLEFGMMRNDAKRKIRLRCMDVFTSCTTWWREFEQLHLSFVTNLEFLLEAKVYQNSLMNQPQSFQLFIVHSPACRPFK